MFPKFEFSSDGMIASFQLLIISREILDALGSPDCDSFLLAKPTADCKNLFVEVILKKPRLKLPSTFVGLEGDRAKRYKSYDFTIDYQTYELKKYTRSFPCDQLFVVEDGTLHEQLVHNSEISAYTEADSKRQPKQAEPASNTSYMEHHSALVKLALILKRLTFSRRLLIVLLLDTLLGAWLGHHVCEWWPSAVEEAVPKARSIVEWLRKGTPLGLKLNPQVNHALANFFTIHVNMWDVYVDVMLPSLRALTNVLSRVGFVPLTLQCALVCDIMTLSTVHVYCFYGYMCKLYALWLSGLFALLRIFRGLKFNPLRQRVDTLTDLDPVILGPIILTIVVFLLPTPFIYYVMFSLMRCCVLLVNFTLGTLMHDLFVTASNIVTALSLEWELGIRRTEITRINEFALSARPSYTRGTCKAFAQGILRIFRFSELLSFLRDLTFHANVADPTVDRQQKFCDNFTNPVIPVPSTRRTSREGSFNITCFFYYHIHFWQYYVGGRSVQPVLP